MKYELCKLDQNPDRGSVIVPFFGRELHVYRRNDRIRAVANTCLHFGGPLECKNDHLVCSWHGAAFDMETGERVSGPAPRSSKLMAISTIVDGDSLYYVWGDD